VRWPHRSVHETSGNRKELGMFANTKALSGFAVDDIEAARGFYADTLGIDVSGTDLLLTLRLAGGRDTLIYLKPDFTPATYTILNFVVDNVEETVDQLASRGVHFERYDGFEQDEKGISRAEGGPHIAWFKDPAGNIVSVLEER
jgi:catechol 2,3-dioxygenase-like lactoylglutathione lyase family enzyme